MKRKYAILLVCLALLSLVSAIFNVDQKLVTVFNRDSFINTTYDDSYITQEGEYYVSKYAKINIKDWNIGYTETTGFINATHFLATVDEYVDNISNRIDMPKWIENHKKRYRDDYYFDSLIKIGFNENSNGLSVVNDYMKLTITLNKKSFENNFSTLPHDIAIIVSGGSSSMSLEEGLGFYMQDQIGYNVNVSNMGIDVHACAKEYMNDSDEMLLNLIGINGNCDPENSRKEYNILSNSFVTYLIETYGMEKFMDLYESTDIMGDYNNIYDKSLDEIKKDWIEFLNNYDDVYTLSKQYIDSNSKVKKVGTFQNGITTVVTGSKDNKALFTLNKSFEDYLIDKYGEEKYEKLIQSDYKYDDVYKKSLFDLKSDWTRYIQNYKS